jgi:hypothetical protein
MVFSPFHQARSYLRHVPVQWLARLLRTLGCPEVIVVFLDPSRKIHG